MAKIDELRITGFPPSLRTQLRMKALEAGMTLRELVITALQSLVQKGK